MLKKFLYGLWIVVLVFVVFLGLRNFINSMENSTFDIRQKVLVNSGLRKHNKDIVIIAIDDASYEYILEKYGEWPLRRDMYAKMVNYIEDQNPKSIAFDLMFVKSIKSNETADNALIEIFKKYDNVFTAMNLDDQPANLRTPPNLPDKLAEKISNPDYFHVMEYSNCRAILQGILDVTSNIGMINVARSDDGVLRQMPILLKYKDKFYPQLGYKVARHYNKEGNIVVYDDGNGEGIILNWYGPSGTFENIPMHKLLKAIEGKGNFEYNFKDKIVYFGATAASLFDIKTVPVDKVYPGVEIQTTYVNNIIDGSYIIRLPLWMNIVFALILGALTILCVMKITSMPIAFCVSLTIYAIYVILTYLAMAFGNLWIEIVAPLIFALFTFITAVITKYLIVAKDFDKQYKLATTDGLTDLYNHRYFQEQMQRAVENAKRYDAIFSLIILDIDFFKQFNDNFGHQSGDAVLRQVAQTLKKNVRSTDIVCRYGGEEMSIILPNTAYEEAISIANKLCEIVGSKKFQLSNHRESNVTISLGVSTYSEQDGQTPEEIISSADKRLYNAKNNGRNRVN